MPEGWSDKRERQYEHIKDSYKNRGISNDEAEERAARTVNKERSEKERRRARTDRCGPATSAGSPTVQIT